MNKKEKVSKLKLEKELKEVLQEIEKESKEMYNSQEYNSLVKSRNDIWNNSNEKNRELRKIKSKVYERYLNDYNHYRYIKITNVKSSVKQGIKRSLGININLIDDKDIINIVEKLFSEDLEKTNAKNIISDVSKYDKKLDLVNKKMNKLREQTNTLEEKRRKIEFKLYREKSYVDKKKLKKRVEVSKMIKEKLPNLIGKIRKEVERGLLLDNLN